MVVNKAGANIGAGTVPQSALASHPQLAKRLPEREKALVVQPLTAALFNPQSADDAVQIVDGELGDFLRLLALLCGGFLEPPEDDFQMVGAPPRWSLVAPRLSRFDLGVALRSWSPVGVPACSKKMSFHLESSDSQP